MQKIQGSSYNANLPTTLEADIYGEVFEAPVKKYTVNTGYVPASVLSSAAGTLRDDIPNFKRGDLDYDEDF